VELIEEEEKFEELKDLPKVRHKLSSVGSLVMTLK
jgi:hypothetical protein